MTAPAPPAGPPSVEDPTTATRTRVTRDLRARRARRDLLVDGACSVALGIIAVVGLRLVYEDLSFLAIGAVAAVAATVAVGLTERFRLDPLLTVVVIVGGFVLCSGVATPDQAIGGFLPSPASLPALVDGLVRGWADLVTTAPPVGTGAGLGVPVYVIAFAGAGGAMLIARRTALALVPVAPALAATGVGFVFGTGEPASVLVQGVVLTALCLGWAAVRAHRPRRSADGLVAWPRVASAGAMLLTVVLVGTVIGPRLPFVDDTDRYNLRQQVVPPFDPRDEPSPLAAFRKYYDEKNKDIVLFRVSGLEAGTRLKLATMDTFDGVVWVVGGPQGAGSGQFERVGAAILPVPPGESATVTVETMADRGDVWAPSAGATRSMTFEGERAELLADSFRYNRDTQSAALPARLGAGDVYQAEVQLPLPRDDAANLQVGIDGGVQLPALPPLPDDLTALLTDLAPGATSPYDLAVRLEQHFQDGYWSNGGEEKLNSSSESAPGHSIARIQKFLAGDLGLVGNAEQYAATMALAARALGLPARVAMGFTIPDGGGPVDIRSGNIDAWVEIAFDDRGWVAFSPTPDKKRLPPDKPQDKTKEKALDQLEPPPPTYLKVPETIPDLASQHPDTQQATEPPPASGTFELPFGVVVAGVAVLVPATLVLAFAALVSALKWRRRKRRQGRRDPVRRLDGAWQEACDQARDLGADLPGRATRRETASRAAAALPGAEALAADVDAAMFGPVPPADETVDAVWSTVDATCRATVRALPIGARIRARLNLTSLRPGRADRVRPAAPDRPPPPSTPPAADTQREPELV